jgi:hypothetical protein
VAFLFFRKQKLLPQRTRRNTEEIKRLLLLFSAFFLIRDHPRESAVKLGYFSRSVASCFATSECGAAESSAAYFSWRAIIKAGSIVRLALLHAGCSSGWLGHNHHASD